MMRHADLLGPLGVTNVAEFDHLAESIVWQAVCAWQADPRRRGPGLLVWMLRRAPRSELAPSTSTAFARAAELTRIAGELAADLAAGGWVPDADICSLELWRIGHRLGEQRMRDRALELTGQLSTEGDELEARRRKGPSEPTSGSVPASEQLRLA